MLARSINARAFQSRLAPGLAQAHVRRLSLAAQPAARTLSKRPALANPVLLGGAAPIGIRNLSIFSGKDSASAPVVEKAAAPAVEQAAEAPVATASQAAEKATEAATSAAAPAAAAAPHHAPEHITANTPDGKFHEDPTPLLPQSPANAETPTLEDLVTHSGLPLEDVLNSPEAIHAAVKLSDLKLIGLDHSWYSAPGWIRDALVGLHDITGLPWWASIMALTLSMRVALLPLVIRNMKHASRMQAVAPQMNGLMKRMTDAKKEGDQTTMMVVQKKLLELFKEHDVSPFRSFLLPMIQVPFFLSMFYALRKMASLPFPQLKEGGFSWVLDLTVPDPLYILPVTSIAFQILVLKLGADGMGGGASNPASQRQMAHFRNGMIALSPLLVAFTSTFPAALLFYWTSANLITLTQSAVFRLPFVRKALGLDYKGASLPPPPADAYVNPNPSLKETWQAIRDWQSNAMEKARTQAAETRARQAIEDERRANKRAGTAQLAERVSEPAQQDKAPESVQAQAQATAGGDEQLARDEARAKRRAAMAARSRK
ncbi:hypothetical protein A1Q1_04071 [Trichosporon asahii var. asahii CBS 2479]|uniref:Membrane insertase YidC/Oxa/ALB C-terminal domain-containing protein n=1 Tax=Trichosporon asahii var. asahii (strain ATCC 90039 / CBS 2479 / JCM 2466 / KCTC 7840 / NBRC 103889/ NCYC 2677 / UAMH 7654) TaxID=1186058 RepID=J5QGB6_TRIAS|nr:hypothetical protein A1Q1_04071 [Trichosporon asahii var. asahii CBS 2479]EJT47213.1 hypothetical protein A1Q1_04071 [Trichosporon asahii var. asahii CBS 2479]